MSALFAVTWAGHGLGATTADTLFFLRFGVEHLPLMILISGPVVMVATILQMAGMIRFGADRWLAPTLLVLAALVALEWVGVVGDVPGVYPVVWLGAQVAILVSFTVAWIAAGEVCTTRQAKRLFPIFASAGIVGAIVGNGLAGPLTSLLGAGNLLLIHTGLLSAGAVIMVIFVRPFLPASTHKGAASVREELKAGLDLTRNSPLLRLLTWLAIAISALFFLVAFRFSELVAETLQTEEAVASYLGTFAAVATAFTLATSVIGTSRLFTRFGVVGTLLIVPAIYLFGFSLWLVTFTLATATLVRGAQWVAVNALAGTAWSALFNGIPGQRRSQVVAFNAAIPTQVGTAAAGALLMVSSGWSPLVMNLIGLGLAVWALALLVKVRRAYTGALVQAVHTGLIEVFSAATPGIQKPTLDADAHTALLIVLSDPNPGRRAIAATMLGRLDSDGGVYWDRALSDEEPRVRAAALQAISDRPDSVPIARTMLADPAPEVRRRAAQTLASHGADLDPAAPALSDSDPEVRASAATLTEADAGRRVIEAMLGSSDSATVVSALETIARRPGIVDIDPTVFLSHPDRQVRAATARCLVGRIDRIDALRALLDDPSLRVRNAAASALAAHPDTADALVDVLSYGSVRACDAALQALADRGLGGERCSQWIAGEVRRARYLRLHRMVLLESPLTETRAYLARLLQAREDRLERWVVMALTVPETEAVMPLLKRGIWANDPETSARALEALDSMTSRSLVSGLVDLLEDDSVPAIQDAGSTLLFLSGDHDQWIRALSIRCLLEDEHTDLDLVRIRAVSDPSPLVRSAVSRSSLQMDETGTFDTIDRVLALQRVPIFSAIDPEDLERIAEVATERTYGPDEVIYSYGGVGNEMLVIISGEVEIRRPDGRPVRTFGAGEHVGELAPLRRGTRTADVIAGALGVHALALGAAELEVILEERPPVAMAMLATLAERLGTPG